MKILGMCGVRGDDPSVCEKQKTFVEIMQTAAEKLLITLISWQAIF